MKKISILGDSVSTFYGWQPEGYDVYYNKEFAKFNGLRGVEDTWWWQVIRYMKGSVLVNASYSGSRVSGIEFPAGNHPRRIGNLRTEMEPDIILVYLGYNDMGYNVPIDREAGLSENEYFRGAYPLMLKRLQDCYPEAEIYCATLMLTGFEYEPGKMHHAMELAELEPYNEVIRQSCSDAGVILVDLASTMMECDTLDGCHSTRRGHRTIAEAWIKMMDLLNFVNMNEE